MLKHIALQKQIIKQTQPPSGGCVLKHQMPADNIKTLNQPPSGGCVLKLYYYRTGNSIDEPAAFRRLCVETGIGSKSPLAYTTSRLQAAVC